MYLEQKIPSCSIVQKMWGSQTMGFPCSEPSAPWLLTRAALQPPMAVNWARQKPPKFLCYLCTLWVSKTWHLNVIFIHSPSSSPSHPQPSSPSDFSSSFGNMLPTYSILWKWLAWNSQVLYQIIYSYVTYQNSLFAHPFLPHKKRKL